MGDAVCPLHWIAHRPPCPLVAAAHNQIQQTSSKAITVITHRLKIMTVPEDTWYKDEGGRDKCIALDVHLLDHADNLVKNHEVRGP